MDAPVNNLRISLEKVLRWVFRILAGVFLLLLVLFACVYVYLQRDPDEFVDAWLGEIAAKTGLEFSIGSIDVTLLPLPAIALGDLRITGKDVEFTAALASARPGFLKILRGDFTPSDISLLRPRLNLITNLPLNKPVETLKTLSTALAPHKETTPDLKLPNLDLNINQLSIEIKGSDNSLLDISGLHTQCSISDTGELSGVLNLSTTGIRQEKKLLLGVENLRISGTTNIYDIARKTRDLAIEGRLRCKNIFRVCDFNGKFDASSSGCHASIELAGDIDLDEAPVPMRLKGTFLRLANEQKIFSRDLTWELGPDSGSLDLALHPGDEKSSAWVKGTLLAHRLSLTEWFGFARNLAPGLQIALDNITSAKIEFTLTEKGLEAQKIQASCSGSTFTGHGGVTEWAKPVVRLTLHTPYADLVTGLPESAAAAPDTPWYPHEPLTPLPIEPLKPGETGIGYDIRLSADKLAYGPIKFEKAALQIHPGKLDVSGFQDVLLDAGARFYGGSVTGQCILGADPSLPYYIAVTSKNINGVSLSKDMPVLPIRQGKFNASATVTSKSKRLDTFLANLKGTLITSGQDVILSAVGAKTPFSRITARLKLRSAAWNGKHLTFNGQWTATVKSSEFGADGELDGKMLFGKNGVSFSALPGKIQISQTKGPLPSGTKISLQGKFGANPDQGKYEVAGGILEALGQKLTGNIKADTSKKVPSFQGNVKTTIPDLATTLAKFGIKKFALPKEYRNLNLEAAIAGQPDTLTLSKIKAKLGTTLVSGLLTWQDQPQRDKFTTDLEISSLAFNNISSRNTPADWNFQNLTTFDARGRITVKQLTLLDTHCSNVAVHYQLENGKLVVNSLTANFYGAMLGCSLTANFRNGVDFDGKLHVQAFNLGKAAQDLKLATILKGSTSLSAEIGAKLSGKKEFLPALRGTWSFNIRDGSWQGTNKQGAPDGNPTTFTSMSASGTLANALVKSDNFILMGKGLNVKGKSSLNISTKELDCNFNVDMKGWPDFPLRVYGPLSNIKTSIGAGKLAINAIGEIVGGFTNAIGGLIRGAVNIFK